MGNNGTYHGDDVLDIGHVRHLSSPEVDDQLASREAGETDEEITDGAAVAIASWWQGPRRGDGLAFAELASSGTVRLEDLADDISAAYDAVSFNSADSKYLDYLATWALNHPSRRSPSE